MLDLLELPLLLGGLALFIYAIGELSGTLRDAFGERAREIIQKYTRNLLMAVLIGTAATVLLDSSSATIVLAIVFINAGALDLRNAVGIILGANIGTTFSSQLIALDVAQYSYIAIVVGLVLSLVARSEGWRTTGRSVLFLGLLFFGLYLMETSVEGLKDSPQFEEWIAKLENPVRGSLIGGLVTLIIQSSSATVGIAIVLGEQELISVAAGLAVMLGAELGTCSDTLLATIGGSRAALKAGIFHITFNLLTIILGLLLFQPFVSLVEWISGEGAEIDRQIANGHLLFNTLGVLIFLPLVGLAVRGLNRLLPEGEATFEQ